MQIQVLNSENWEQLNEAAKNQLGISDDSKMRVFNDLYQAVYEICQGTSQFMSHKKSIGIIQGLSSFESGLLPAYYRDLYEVQKMDFRKLTTPESIETWADEIKRETCFVLSFAEHAITGEQFVQADYLEKKLTEKRIVSIVVTQDIEKLKVPVEPYTARVVGLPSGKAIVKMGARYRAPAILSNNISWKKNIAVEVLEEISSLQKRVSSIEALREFEKQFANHEEITPFLRPEIPRTSDRSLLVLAKVHADALAGMVRQRIPTRLEDNLISSLSGCHWGQDEIFTDWWAELSQKKLVPSQILVIDTQLLQYANFAETLISSYRELLEQQSWKL